MSNADTLFIELLQLQLHTHPTTTFSYYLTDEYVAQVLVIN